MSSYTDNWHGSNKKEACLGHHRGGKERAIVLTAHSKEEADIRSERIAIMAKGKLRSIRNSIRLKSKFGTHRALTSLGLAIF
jgi:ABC-type multidrug transport system ATPase subunit